MILEDIERKVIRLVEERGVAASKYNIVVDKIIKYCEEYVRNSRYAVMEFSIPKDITKGIDFIDNVGVNVKVSERKDGFYMTGGGGAKTRYMEKIIDGKLAWAEINIDGYSYNHSLFKKTLLTSLYHEINHVYECYKDVVKNKKVSDEGVEFGESPRYTKSSLRGGKALGYETPILSNKEDNFLLKKIFYRLFSETELNALIASVYGNLKGIGSKRKNFRNDMKCTKAYTVYTEIKDNYVRLFNSINDDNIGILKRFLSDCDIKINPYSWTTDGVKKELKRKTGWLLMRLFRGIGRAASLYYDNDEIEQLPEYVTTVNPSIIIEGEHNNPE